MDWVKAVLQADMKVEPAVQLVPTALRSNE